MEVLKLGEVLDKLNWQRDEELLNVEITGDWYSWRGSYDYIAIEFLQGGKNYSTVENLKDVLNSALNTGKMHGYKGGEYNIDYDTPLVFTTDYRDSFGLEVVNIGFDFEGLKISVQEV